MLPSAANKSIVIDLLKKYALPHEYAVDELMRSVEETVSDFIGELSVEVANITVKAQPVSSIICVTINANLNERSGWASLCIYNPFSVERISVHKGHSSPGSLVAFTTAKLLSEDERFIEYAMSVAAQYAADNEPLISYKQAARYLQQTLGE